MEIVKIGQDLSPTTCSSPSPLAFDEFWRAHRESRSDRSSSVACFSGFLKARRRVHSAFDPEPQRADCRERLTNLRSRSPTSTRISNERN